MLLQGYTQTSLMWKPVIPLISKRFTVVAPDFPAIADSAIPTDGLDMKTAAVCVHELTQSLRVNKAKVVGHDYQSNGRLCVCRPIFVGNRKTRADGRLSSRREWMGTDLQRRQHLALRFQWTDAEALVQRRERTYFQYFWNDLAADRTRSVPEADREAYISCVLSTWTNARGLEILPRLRAGRYIEHLVGGANSLTAYSS